MTRFTAFLSASSSGQLYDVQQHPSRILGMPRTLPRQLALNLFAEPTGFMGTDPSTVLPSGQIFAPALPDTATLVGFGSVVLLSALATFVWANQVVPVARTNLARSKQRGPVRDYLDELQELKEAVVAAQHNNNNNATATTTPSRDDRVFELWLFADWLLQHPAERRRVGRQKEPALPILKSAKWNSGDNPVLAASALIVMAVFASSVVERATSLFHSQL